MRQAILSARASACSWVSPACGVITVAPRKTFPPSQQANKVKRQVARMTSPPDDQKLDSAHCHIMPEQLTAHAAVSAGGYVPAAM